MKKAIIFLFCLIQTVAFGQSSLLVGQQAPDFSANAVMQGHLMETISLRDFRGKYVILFFYPLDFTFVCPTELLAFQERLDDFEQRNGQLIGCSVDSAFTHLA